MAEPAPHGRAAPAGGGGASIPADVRSSFGFDRTEEGWLAMVREATAPAGVAAIGPYRVLAEIGRGSQGAVYKAVQPGTQRAIAIKRVATGGFASARARARFEREIEAGAALSHPGIVTVLGADCVDEQPVLLMEWVDGDPIDRWAFGPPGAAASARPMAERLELFAQVCDAVAHAHQRGVLHRDLKPSNILVDRQGRPRILDFGLAKLLSHPAPHAATDDRRSCLTATGGGLLGTPAFAAPEQLAGDAADADTRTDVYALGGILYLLITGRLPFEHTDDLAELVEAVRHRTPRRPSLLTPEANDELDAITQTAMAKEPHRRYQSADALGADVRRYLAGQAVLAHPPSAAYHLRTLVRRHRVLCSAVAVATVAVVALAVTSSWLAVRLAGRGRDLAAALAQAQDAERTAQTEALRNAASVEFLQGMIDAMGEAAASGEARPTRAMILSARERLQSGTLSVQPELEVTLWRRLARAAYQLGMIPEATDCTARLAQLCERQVGPDHVEVGWCRLMQGLLAESRSDLDRAAAMYRESSRIFTASVGEQSAENALAINDLGGILQQQGRYGESLAAHERALAIRTRLLGPVHRDVAMSLRNLGSLMRVQHRFDEAKSYYDRALDTALRAGSPLDRSVLAVRLHLARLARDQGRFEEAEAIVRDCIALYERAYGEDSAAMINPLGALSDLFERQRRWADAAAVRARSTSLSDRHMPADHPQRATLHTSYGCDLLAAGRAAEAEPELRLGMELAAMCDPPAPETARKAGKALDRCLAELGRPSADHPSAPTADPAEPRPEDDVAGPGPGRGAGG